MSCNMVQSMYIAEGFMEDCELLTRTLTDKYEKVDWPKFCEQWKAMRFDQIYYGRNTGPEVVELTEELLQCSRLYFVTETDNYEDQVVGLFITYAITVIQPYKKLCSLRVTPEDVGPLKRFEAKARSDSRTDVLMILARVYVYSTHCHVSRREQAMDFSIRKYFDDSTRVPKAIVKRWHGELNRTNLRSWQGIAHKERDYLEIKNKARAIAESAYPGSNVLVDTFTADADNIAESLRKLLKGPNLDNDSDEEKHDITSIKQKAMKKKVDPMKHLCAVDDRHNTPETKSPERKSPETFIAKHYKRKKTTEATLLNIRQEISNNKMEQTSPIEEPSLPVSVSLPAIHNDDGHEKYEVKREGSPEEPFKGFTLHEINNTALKKGLNISKTIEKKLPDLSILDGVSSTCAKKLLNTSKGRKLLNETMKKKVSPKNVALKRRSNNQPKKIAKRKRSSKYTVSSDSESRSETPVSSDDMHSDTSDEANAIELNLLDADNDTELFQAVKPKVITKNVTCERKELDVNIKGTVKRVIQYVLDDIVIQTDKDAPEKDVEIEYIDNYTGDAVDSDVEVHSVDNVTVKKKTLYEEVCEVSDKEDVISDDDSKNVSVLNKVSQVKHKTVDNKMGESGSNTKDKEDETVEVFQIINDTTEAIDLNVLTGPRKTARRHLKRPNLRSRFKKLGILPVADFEGD